MYNLKEVITMQSLEDLFYTVSAEKKSNEEMRITLRMSQIDRVRLNQHLRNKKKNQTYKSNYKTLSNFTFKIHRKTTN